MREYGRRLLILVIVVLLVSCTTPEHTDSISSEQSVSEFGRCYTVGKPFLSMGVCEDYEHRVVCYARTDTGMVCFRMMDSDLQGW